MAAATTNRKMTKTATATETVTSTRTTRLGCAISDRDSQEQNIEFAGKV
jgi:hypothetical protein